MPIRQRVLACSIRLLKGFIVRVKKDNAPRLLAKIVESLSPTRKVDTQYGNLELFCPGVIPEWRARTLLSKEPDTIDWISRFANADVFWDIGANIGTYSLFAALKGHPVLAFEPSSGSYYLLNKNIELNRLDGKIAAYCVAFHERSTLASLYLKSAEIGESLNSFGEAVDWQGRSFTPSMRQGMLGFSIDDFIEKFHPPFPHHIKLDVDGNEEAIISGARKTLRDPRLKSILVELDGDRPDLLQRTAAILLESGLAPAAKSSSDQLRANAPNHELNHIFVRSTRPPG